MKSDHFSLSLKIPLEFYEESSLQIIQLASSFKVINKKKIEWNKQLSENYFALQAMHLTFSN